MKKKKLNRIQLNDSNNTIIETRLSEEEFMKLYNNPNRYNSMRPPFNFDYQETVLSA